MRRLVRAFKVFWHGASALSTLQWLLGILPAGAVAVMVGWVGMVEQMPPVVIGVLAFVSAAVAYVVYVAFRIDRLQTQPNLAGHARERSLRNKAEIVADIASDSYRKRDDGSEASRKNELAAKRARLRDSQPSDWVPFHQALRYLVYESSWAARQPAVANEEEFNRVVSAEVRERLARGDIASRGQLGWDRESQRATEPIPAEYWTDAFFLPFSIIALADGGDPVGKQKGGGAVYQCVILNWADVKGTWRKGVSPSDGLTALASCVEDRRAACERERASQKQSLPPLREIVRALDDELRDEDEKTRRRLATILSPGRLPRAAPRNCNFSEALGWAIHGDWSKPYHITGLHFPLAATTDPRKLLVQFTERAADGRLTFWGKRDDPGHYEQIPQSHWEENDLTLADMFGTVVSGSDNPYRQLMLNRAEVEREWPHEG